MATKNWAIILVILCTFFTASAQVLWKIGVKVISLLDLTTIIFNYPLILGCFLYIIAALLLLVAFKGGEANVLYPIIATGYIWVIILSMIFFNEIINIIKLLGIAFIFFGVSFIGYGGKKHGY